jgi:NDP-mannose synthase
VQRAASRRAVVLAGGLGTRLQPYTTVLPKPLMPIGDRPVLDIVVRQLRRHGFERVTIATGHLAELIEAFFGDGSRHGIPIDYFREDRPLGTVGSLALIDGLEDDFLVMNGDILTDMDYGALLAAHHESGATATVAVTSRVVEIDLGVLEFSDNGMPDRITACVEKPHLEYTASMGVYCFSPQVLRWIDAGQPLDFPDLVQRLLDGEELVRGWRSDCYWMDIGRHDDYEQALEDYPRMRDALVPDGDAR